MCDCLQMHDIFRKVCILFSLEFFMPSSYSCLFIFMLVHLFINFGEHVLEI